MNETNGPESRSETVATKKRRSGRLALLLIVCVVAVAAVLPRLLGPARQKVKGTITAVDVDAGRATLEYIDPANGATREVTGEVPESCKITIDGEPAKLADLKIGDTVKARALIQRHREGGKSGKRIVAEEIRVTRAPENNP